MNSLDEAILRNRQDPSPANEARVLAEMRKRNDKFMTEQADEFIRRTK